MKKFGTLIGALLLCVCFLFAGCSTPLEMPTGEVKSNGGNSVVVGDYLYFANTFVTTSSLTTGANDEGKVGNNAIYRIKTNSDGKVETDENEAAKIEKVMSKIAGFETSNMFAKGDYLYFTSPNAHKSSKEEEQGKDRFDLTTLFRCKLDGTGLKEIMTTQTSAGKFYLAKQGEKDVLFVFDDNKIQTIEIANKLGKKQVLVEDVVDVVFPQEFGATLTELFYTAALTEEDGTNEGITGNKLYRYNIAEDKSTLVRQKNAEQITLVAYDTNRLYYTRTNGSIVAYFSNSLKGNFEVDEVQHTYVDSADVTEFYAFGTDEEGNILPVIYVYKSKLLIQPYGENYQVMAEGAVTVEFISGEYVYYTTDTGIYRKSYFNPTAEAVQITDQKNIKAGAADFDGRFIYFYAQTDENLNSTGNYYMYRANTKSAELGRMKTECIADVLSEDLAENTDEETGA